MPDDSGKPGGTCLAMIQWSANSFAFASATDLTLRMSVSQPALFGVLDPRLLHPSWPSLVFDRHPARLIDSPKAYFALCSPMLAIPITTCLLGVICPRLSGRGQDVAWTVSARHGKLHMPATSEYLAVHVLDKRQSSRMYLHSGATAV